MGAILLALFMAAVAAYRIIRENPITAVTREAPKPAPPRAPDPRFSAGSPTPPPPPASSKKTTHHAASPIPEPVQVEPEPPPPEKIEREAPAEIVEQPPQPAQEKIEDLPEPVAPVAKSPGRPKRWLHAVGRFLHVVPN